MIINIIFTNRIRKNHQDETQNSDDVPHFYEIKKVH